MRILTKVDCNGETILAEVGPDGELFLHDYDLDADMATQELGFGRSACLDLLESWDENRAKTFIDTFVLNGDAWLSILVEWAGGLAWTYSDMVKIVSNLQMDGPGLPITPLQALQALQQHVRYGDRFSDEDTADMSRATREAVTALDRATAFIEDAFNETISSMVGAAESFLIALSDLLASAPGMNGAVLSSSSAIREKVASKLIEAHYLVNFYDIRTDPETKQPYQDIIIRASEQVEEDVKKMISNAVGVVIRLR